MTIDGERIRRLRGRAGLSQGQVAGSTGLSQGYLSQLENGDVKNPSFRVIALLAEALGVKTMELVGEVDPDIPIHPALRRLLVDMPLPTQGALAELMEVLRASEQEDR